MRITKVKKNNNEYFLYYRETPIKCLISSAGRLGGGGLSLQEVKYLIRDSF